MHHKMRHKTSDWATALVALGLWGSGALPAAQAQAAPPVAQAACVIRLAPQILLVQDALSHRYALPAGAIRPHERPQNAAVRATQQTTGLVVTAQRQLGVIGGQAVFDCQLRAPAPLLSEGVVLLPAAARYTSIEARFIEARTLAPQQWRYMRQMQPTLALVDAATSHDAKWLRYAAASSSPLFEAELAITRAVQRGMPKPLCGLVTWLSQLGTELALFLVAILVWCLCGWRHGLEFTLYMTTVSLVNCLLKQGCALPRPFYLDPHLQLQHASSFGFPSGHTACVSSMALWLAVRVLPRRRSVRAALVMAVLGCSVSRVYLGVHFTHDVLGAWLESLIFGALYAAWWRRCQQAYVPLGHWAVLNVVLACVALGGPLEPEPIVFMCINAGLLIGSVCCRGASRPLAWMGTVTLGGLMALGFVVLHRYVAYARPQEASFVACLQRIIAGGLGRGLCMPVLSGAAMRLGQILDAKRGLGRTR